MERKKVFSLCVIMFLCAFGFKMNVYADLRSEATEKSCDELISSGVLNKSSGNFLFDGSSYKTNCVYIKKEKKSCVIFQLAFTSDEGTYKVDTTVGSAAPYVQQYKGKKYKILSFEFIDQYETLSSAIVKEYGDVCPLGVNYLASLDPNSQTASLMSTFRIGDASPNMIRFYNTGISPEIPSLIIPGNSEAKSCKELLGESGVKALKTVKNIIFVIVPIILIALGVLDFAQAVFAQSEDNIKKSQQKFIKRLIIALGIFLIPTILSVLLSIAHTIWPVIDNQLCGIL